MSKLMIRKKVSVINTIDRHATNVDRFQKRFSKETFSKPLERSVRKAPDNFPLLRKGSHFLFFWENSAGHCDLVLIHIDTYSIISSKYTGMV